MGLYEVLPFNKELSKISNFFNKSIYKNEIIFIDFYSIIHIFFGFLVALGIHQSKRNRLQEYGAIITLLLLWEVFELFMGTYTSLFLTDSPKNLIWDLIFGIFGAVAFDIYYKRNKKL